MARTFVFDLTSLIWEQVSESIKLSADFVLLFSYGNEFEKSVVWVEIGIVITLRFLMHPSSINNGLSLFFFNSVTSSLSQLLTFLWPCRAPCVWNDDETLCYTAFLSFCFKFHGSFATFSGFLWSQSSKGLFFSSKSESKCGCSISYVCWIPGSFHLWIFKQNPQPSSAYFYPVSDVRPCWIKPQPSQNPSTGSGSLRITRLKFSVVSVSGLLIIPTHICWYVYQNVPRLVQQGVYAHALSLSAVHGTMCPGRSMSH